MSFFQPVPNGQILLVEDDETARELLAAALRLRGFHVRTAADGLTALRLLDEFEPHAVVVDLLLPMASGFEIMHELKTATSTRSTPVIAISGDDHNVRLAREDPGFFATLQKPFDPEMLVKTVTRATRLQQT
jgi:two-component system OmpR family response regulator